MDEDDSTVPSADWFEAMTTVLGNGLAICRVTRTSVGQLTVIWRNPPSDADKAKADALIGSAAHAW
jgi:hypothetical protein